MACLRACRFAPDDLDELDALANNDSPYGNAFYLNQIQELLVRVWERQPSIQPSLLQCVWFSAADARRALLAGTIDLGC